MVWNIYSVLLMVMLKTLTPNPFPRGRGAGASEAESRDFMVITVHFMQFRRPASVKTSIAYHYSSTQLLRKHDGSSPFGRGGGEGFI